MPLQRRQVQPEGVRLGELADTAIDAPAVKLAAKVEKPSKAVGDLVLGYLIEALRPTVIAIGLRAASAHGSHLATHNGRWPK